MIATRNKVLIAVPNQSTHFMSPVLPELMRQDHSDFGFFPGASGPRGMKPKDARICIVGAGPAGLSAAHALKTRGYTNVVVLEAQERVGGKCRTINFNGRSFDVGANYVTAAYSEVRKLARAFGATLYTQFAATTARMSPSGEITFRTPLKAITQSGSLLAFFKAALRYSLIRFRLRAVVDPPGFDRLKSDILRFASPFATG